MLKHSLPTILKHDFASIFKTSGKSILGVGILVGFLLFLLNIFLGISFYAHNFTGELKERLGMYFYLKDAQEATTDINKRIITLKDELEAQGLKVMFSSKEDALAFLQKKIPDIVSNFQKFGIDNPLPATLYVMFDSEKQYESLKTTILKYKDIIQNTKDVDAGTTLKDQENRVLTIINLSNFVVGLSYLVIFILLAIIITFLGFLLQDTFYAFHKELEIKKHLGASYRQIIQSFVTLTTYALGFSFVICLILLIISGITINYYLYTLFDITFLTVFHNILFVIGIFVGELVLVGAMGLGFSRFFAKKLNSKL